MPLGDRGDRVFLGVAVQHTSPLAGRRREGHKLHDGRCLVRKVLNAALTRR